MYKKELEERDQLFQVCAEGELNGIQVFIGSGSVLELYRIGVEGILNCANEKMEHGGGLALEIALKAGEEFTQECKNYIRRFGYLERAQVISTTAGNMKYKRILHVAGPVVTRLRDDQMYELQSCVVNCLKQAADDKLCAVGIPGISCGTFGFPKKEAAYCHLKGFIKFASVNNKSNTVKQVYFTLFSSEELLHFVNEFQDLMNKDLFDYSRFLGVPEQRVSIFFSICGTCKNILPVDDFNINNCHKVCCNYCVYRYNLGECFTCHKIFREPFQYEYFSEFPLFVDSKFVYCRECKVLQPKNSSCCSRCDNMCEKHFPTPNSFCPYCKNARNK